MSLNKLQLKAKIFKIIAPLKNAGAIDDLAINEIIANIRNIQDVDFYFVSRILIKEADSEKQKTANAFFYIAQVLSPESYIPLLMNEVRSDKISDSKKLFILNALAGAGVQFYPSDLPQCFKDPKGAIDNETKKFLENAKFDPEAQVDFLDFYFTSGSKDKKELIDSVANDFEGDKLVNILSPLSLAEDNAGVIYYCLELMQENKSLLSIKPLTYLSELDFIPEVQKKAFKLLQKYTFQGFYTEEKLLNFYKELLSGYLDPEVYISSPDGNSNFSIVVVRKMKDNSVYILFAAENVELGPFSAFGFSGLSERDYLTIINRFFDNREHYKINPESAKAIMHELLVKRIKLNKIIPYEYFPWERLLDDIKKDKRNLDEILLNGAKNVELTTEKEKIIENLPHVENWFFRYSKNAPFFANLMNETLKLNDNNISNVEIYILKSVEDETLQSKIKNRLKYLVFCLKSGGLNDEANLCYSLLFDDKMFKIFLSNILKRSIYEFALVLRLPDKRGGKTKNLKNIKDEKAAKLIIDYVEREWINGN